MDPSVRKFRLLIFLFTALLLTSKPAVSAEECIVELAREAVRPLMAVLPSLPNDPLFFFMELESMEEVPELWALWQRLEEVDQRYTHGAHNGLIDIIAEIFFDAIQSTNATLESENLVDRLILHQIILQRALHTLERQVASTPPAPPLPVIPPPPLSVPSAPVILPAPIPPPPLAPGVTMVPAPPAPPPAAPKLVLPPPVAPKKNGVPIVQKIEIRIGFMK